MNQKGMASMIEGMVGLVVIIFTFAVVYPVLDAAINTLQNTAGTSVDLISSAYLPIMAIVLFIAIVKLLRPDRPTEYNI